MQSLKEGTCRFGNETDQVKVNFMKTHKKTIWINFSPQNAVVTTLGTFQLIKGVAEPPKPQVKVGSFQKRRSSTWTSRTFSEMMFPNLNFQESRTGSTFCKNLARYMSSASEERKFYDLVIITRSKTSTSDNDDCSTGMEANCQLIRSSSPHRRVILRDSSDRRTQARCRLLSILT